MTKAGSSFSERFRYSDLENAVARAVRGVDASALVTLPNRQMCYVGNCILKIQRNLQAGAPACPTVDNVAVIKALKLLIDRIDDIASGFVTGEKCIGSSPSLWPSIMCDWPMGRYGRELANCINTRCLGQGRILELGAGCGHASRFLRLDSGTHYIKSDLRKPLLHLHNSGHILVEYDINDDRIPFRNLDMVFASNVLHCAREKLATLKRVFEMLKPGGWLLFSEGTPVVAPGREWCLSVFFGFFDGWWDQGGFQTKQYWATRLETAGFDIQDIMGIWQDGLSFGAVYIARKPGISD